MTNEVTVFQDSTNTKVSTRFNQMIDAGLANDLGEGIRAGGFGVISIKGSKFRVKYKGEEFPVTDVNGDPVPSLEVVIIRANPYITKQYYKGKWSDGSNDAPDCFSLDGKVPAAAVQSPMHTNCAACPMNAFGSRINDAGNKVKACSDTKRLAVAPLMDLRNEAHGGPMLFRVPPSSLKDLQSFADLMKSRGYPYNSVAVRIGFDINASHAKPTFRAIRPLTDDEAEVILELFHGDAVSRILADFDAPSAPVETAPEDDAFEQPVAQAVKSVAQVAKPVAAKPVAAKLPAPATGFVMGAPAKAAPQTSPQTKQAAPGVVMPGAPKSAKKAAKPVQADIEDAQVETAVVADPANNQLDDDIANILADLNRTAG